MAREKQETSALGDKGGSIRPRTVTLMALMLLVAGAGMPLAGSIVPAPEDGDRASHPPIHITQEEGPHGFILGHDPQTGDPIHNPAAGVRSGDGTVQDPYVIEGWRIVHDEGAGVHIEGTDAHVVLRDNRISSWRGRLGTAVELTDASNVTVAGNELVQNRRALDVHHSRNLLLVDNLVADNDRIGPLHHTKNTTIENHTFRRLPASSSFINLDVEDAQGFTLANSSFLHVDGGLWVEKASALSLENNTFRRGYPTVLQHVHQAQVRDNRWGNHSGLVALADAHNVTFADNAFTDGSIARLIVVWDSSGNAFERNTFVEAGSSYPVDNLLVWGSPNNRFRDNRMPSGLGLFGYEADAFEQDIDASNTAGGDPIRYIEGQPGAEIEDPAGQLILVSSPNTTVSNRTFEDVGSSITAVSSPGLTVKDARFRNVGAPLFAFRSPDTHVENVTVRRSSYLGFVEGDDTSLVNSTFTGSRGAIWIHSDNASGVGNRMGRHGGLSLWNAKHALLAGNHIESPREHERVPDPRLDRLLDETGDLILCPPEPFNGSELVEQALEGELPAPADCLASRAANPIETLEHEWDELWDVFAELPLQFGFVFIIFFLPVPGITAGWSHDVAIRDNTIGNVSLLGHEALGVFGSRDVDLDRNTIHDTDGPGIEIDAGTANVTLDGTVSTGNDGPGLLLQGVEEASIEDATLTDNAGHGLLFEDEWGAGLQRRPATNVSVSNATVRDNGGDGIGIHGARNLDVTDSTIEGNEAGVAAGAETQGVRIAHNLVEGNAEGVELAGSAGVHVLENDITANRLGVRVQEDARGQDPLPGLAIHQNNLWDNDEAGLSGEAARHANATSNWWGCPDGPLHPDCDDVQGNARFVPWRAAPVPGAGPR